MNPNANLAEQLRLVELLIADACTQPEWESHAARLVDLVEALDAWLRKGGALPDAWRKPCRLCGSLNGDDDCEVCGVPT